MLEKNDGTTVLILFDFFFLFEWVKEAKAKYSGCERKRVRGKGCVRSGGAQPKERERCEREREIK